MDISWDFVFRWREINDNLNKDFSKSSEKLSAFSLIVNKC